MKKVITLVVLICIFSILHCGKEYTRLIITIAQQPEGGNDVTEILCIIHGRLVDGDTPIQASFDCLWKEEADDPPVIYWSDTQTFHSAYDIEVWMPLYAPAGSVWNGYFWFEIQWEDEDGTPNLVVTDTAFCYHLGN